MADNAQLVEQLAETVHQAYLDTCERLGWPVKPENQVPYAELSEDSKELDRASVRAVLDAVPAGVLARLAIQRGAVVQVGWNRPELATRAWPDGPFFCLADNPEDHAEDEASPGLEPLYRLATEEDQADV